MAKFNKYENVCLHACSSVSGVSIVDVMGSSKKKEVVMARSLTCSVLKFCGFGIREISRITNTDAKGVSIYIEGHDNRMADVRYERNFTKAIQFINTYEEFSDEALSDKVQILYEIINKLN
jgi:hypothetical protein